LIRIGGSLGLTLPHKFLKEKSWKAGDRISLVYDDIAVIIRLPTDTKREEKREEKNELAH